MRILAALFFAVPMVAAAQTPQVPHKMSFADLTLTIRDDARREIQKDVDALTQSPKHFNIKADRARTFFPIIEKIFAEEGVPDDFKYLVLQESSLIADAVSVSNAVGFWQFKDFTAMEMGLRVDQQVDERMHIAASTRAAARYIKKNNSLFDNWLYALQAYQMGAGGVMNSVDNIEAGRKHAEITARTYWYVRKFLAYKIAFEDAVKGKGQIELTVYENRARKTLADLSQELSVPEEELRAYNKWVRADVIPDDHPYSVLVPFSTGVSLPVVVVAPKLNTAPGRVDPVLQERAQPAHITVNGVPAVIAVKGETALKLAERTRTDLANFLLFNEITYTTPIVEGANYFLAKKRNRGAQDFHISGKGEDLWMISQRYGVKLRKLRKFNRLEGTQVEAGTTIYLASMKPKKAHVSAVSDEVAVVEKSEPFNWTSSPVVVPVNEESHISASAGQDVSSVRPEVEEMKEADSVKILQPVKEGEVRTDTIRTASIAPQYQDRNFHVVRPRETLYGIANLYGVTVMDLVRWNNVDLQQGIKIGQTLKVSESQSVAVAGETALTEVIHEVRSSDTLFSIARKYGVTIKELMQWNDKKDFSLSVGEKLKIKSAR